MAGIAYDVLIRWPLPDGDGLECCTAADEARFSSVLVMTAFDAICERVASLDAGADDACHPADNDEIAARLRALLRRPGPRSLPSLAVGGLVFDVAARRAAPPSRCRGPTDPQGSRIARASHAPRGDGRAQVGSSPTRFTAMTKDVTRSRRGARLAPAPQDRGPPTARRTMPRRSIPSGASATCCARMPQRPRRSTAWLRPLRDRTIEAGNGPDDSSPSRAQRWTRATGCPFRFDRTAHLSQKSRQAGPKKNNIR